MNILGSTRSLTKSVLTQENNGRIHTTNENCFFHNRYLRVVVKLIKKPKQKTTNN